jgi:hypothetical protein
MKKILRKINPINIGKENKQRRNLAITQAALSKPYQLLHLDVEWVVVLAEEDLELVLQQVRAPLQHHPDVLQCDVVDLRHRTREQRH